MNHLDRERLGEALALAETAVGVSDPNPRVGCIIGAADGRVFGRGATQRAGGPHAEVVALREARAAGHELNGATVWVTLEPCAHHGRTPPCADALVAAGVGRVVVAAGDPFPAVAGAGLERLRAAGIAVELADRDLRRSSHELNIGFFSRVLRGRPWVRLKSAASLDGRTALPDGRSQWITGPEARADGHAWRRRAGAVLSGIGTVLADDPRLDVRLVPTVLQPLRVVVDSVLRLPPTARIISPPGHVVIATAAAHGERAEALRRHGVECLELPGADGRVDLGALLARLTERGVNELHVEAGAVLSGALLQAGLVDELLVYAAPCLIGDGRPIASLPAWQGLEAVPRWRFVEAAPVGDDLRLRLRRADPATWLDAAAPGAVHPETRDAGLRSAG